MITSLELADINRSLADMHHRLSELERKARPTPKLRKPREWRIPVLHDQPFLYQQPMPPEGEFVTVREVLPE